MSKNLPVLTKNMPKSDMFGILIDLVWELLWRVLVLVFNPFGFTLLLLSLFKRNSGVVANCLACAAREQRLDLTLMINSVSQVLI